MVASVLELLKLGPKDLETRKQIYQICIIQIVITYYVHCKKHHHLVELLL